MAEQQFKASMNRSKKRNSWCVIFRNTLRKDGQGRVGLRVRRGLGTSDLTEAEQLKDEMNALLSNPAWLQVLADVLGRPVEVSGVPEGSARGAAMVAFERLGLPVPPAPVARVVEPRAGQHEIHLRSREVQRSTMHIQEAR